MDFDDHDNLARLRSKDNTVFSQLVASYHRTLTTVARSIIGEALADEVVQESWIMAYNAFPEFEGRSKVKTWLFTIVANHAKTRLRKESRTLSMDSHEENSEEMVHGRFGKNGHWVSPVGAWHLDTPDGLLEQEQLRCCIEHTLKLLPPMQKAVFSLREIEQMPLLEICNNLEVSESNVRVLLHRARLKLYQVIEHYQETGEC